VQPDSRRARVPSVDFADFYRATSPRTLRYAYGLTGDLAQAQDVVQEAYVRAWQRWRKLAGYDDAEAWLRLVVSRLAFDWLRHLRVRRTTILPAPATVPAPSEDAVLVVAALKKLPERQRRAIALHYLLDRSVGDIATELGVSEGTVKSWLSRGRDTLAASLLPDTDSVALPAAEDVADLGRRRRRTRVGVTVTAAGLALIAVIVVVTAVLGRDRALPPPPTVTPTGSPMTFAPLRRTGAVNLAGATAEGVIVQGDRAFVMTDVPNGVRFVGVDLTTMSRMWQTPVVPVIDGALGGTAVAPQALMITTGDTTLAYDPESGRKLWSRSAPALFAAPRLFPGVAVFIDKSTGDAVGIDPATGVERWRVAGPVQSIFGMKSPADLDTLDDGTGMSELAPSTANEVLLADGRGTISEYAAATGQPTGRAWHGVPPSDGYLAYNGAVYMRSAREAYRLDLAGGKQTRIYSGGGVSLLVPCGATDVCLVDATEAGGEKIVAVHDSRIKWTVPVDSVHAIAPIGRYLRVFIRSPNETNVVLDEQGHEVLRLTGDVAGLIRLNAGNMLGYQMSGDFRQARIVGIPAATMRQKALGTVALNQGTGLTVEGSTLAVIQGQQLVVYRIE
jgi:RNA polymerase sigma-70 factor (sigma-E family)